MSHELHLSKLIKRLIFSCFHFHHPQYLGGRAYRINCFWGPAANHCSAEAAEECCSSLGGVHPSWGHLLPVQTCTPICWLALD